MNEVRPGWVALASVLAGVLVAVVLWQRGPAPPQAYRPPAPPFPAHLAPGEPTKAVGTERLEGHVEDDLGLPLEGVAVRVRLASAPDGAPAVARTTTDGAGNFELAGLPAAIVDLEAQLALHESDVLPDLALPRSDPEPIRIVLARTAALAGKVLDADGQAAAGARITVAGSGLWPPKTLDADAAGEFRISPLPGGVYEVRAGLDTRTSDPQEGIIIEAGREAFVSIVLIEGTLLRGRAFDAATGDALVGAAVVVSEDSLTAVAAALQSDAEGRFQVPGLRALPHRVSIRAPGYVPVTGESREPGESEHDFPMRRAGVLEGVVLDPQGDPIAGAELEVLGTTDRGGEVQMNPAALRFQRDLMETRLAAAAGSAAGAAPATGDNLGVTRGAVPKVPLFASPGAGQEARKAEGQHAPGGASADDLERDLLALRSGADGRFRIEGVPPGRIQVLARKPGYAPARARLVTLSSGETRDGIEVQLSLGGQIRGRVLDGSGFPIETARVQLDLPGEPFGRVVLTQADGEFSFDAVLGACIVTAHRHGQSPVRRSVEVHAGATEVVDLVFGETVSVVEGRVLGPRGYPVAGASVRLESTLARFPAIRTTSSGGDGSFSVQGMPSPPYRVRVEHSQYAPTELASAEPGERGIEVRLEPGATLKGTARDGHEDQPLAGAQVELMGVELPVHQRTRTDSSGGFAFRNLHHGSYLLIARRSGYVSERVEVEVAGDSEAPTLELLPSGTISGEVVDRFGAPLFNAEVTTGIPPLWARAVRTDHTGSFKLVGLPAGDHRISARHTDAGATERPTSVRVFTLQETPGQVLRLPGEASATPTPAARPDGDGEHGDGVMAPGVGDGGQHEGVAIRVGFAGGHVVVEAVAPQSRARAAGLRNGDVLLGIDGEAVHVASQARAMLRGTAGSTAVLSLQRGKRQQRVLVERERHRTP